LGSAWRVCLLIILAVVLSGLIYTMDFEIMGCLVAIAVVACILLLFFMLCIFQWQFGPWQLIVSALFLTYTIEPAFHIGRDFVLPASLPASEPDAPLCDDPPARTTEMFKKPEGDKDLEQAAPFQTCTSTVAIDGSLELRSGKVADTTGTFLGASNSVDKGGVPGIEPIMPAASPSETRSEASSGPKGGEDPAPALERSVYLACETIMASAVQLFLCGILILPCEFRLFMQLGAVAVLVPLIWVPAIVLILPAALLYSGRTRREPDIFLLARHLEQVVSNLL